jgi:hypothetical protein
VRGRARAATAASVYLFPGYEWDIPKIMFLTEWDWDWDMQSGIYIY